MRRVVTTLVCGVVVACVAGFPTWGATQSFGFPFGGPRHRAQPRHAQPKAEVPHDIPMPVPRPHFAAQSPAPPAKDVAPGTKEASPTTKEALPATKEAVPASKDATPAATANPNVGKAQPPTVSPVGASQAFTPRAPADDPTCPGTLAGHHIVAERIAIGPQPDARCTVIEPVKLTSSTLPDGSIVEFPDHPTIACTTADAFSRYIRDLLVPLAKGTFGSSIAIVWTGPGLECRSRDHIFGAKLSAHGQGLAIDIAQLKLADGRVIAVGTPKTDAETGFETAARAAACGYFHTVLGPGSDSYHRTHWHFDLEVRGSGGDAKYCK